MKSDVGQSHAFWKISPMGFMGDTHKSAKHKRAQEAQKHAAPVTVLILSLPSSFETFAVVKDPRLSHGANWDFFSFSSVFLTAHFSVKSSVKHAPKTSVSVCQALATHLRPLSCS